LAPGTVKTNCTESDEASVSVSRISRAGRPQGVGPRDQLRACQTGSGINPSEAERADHMSNIDLQIVRQNWEGIRHGSLHRQIQW
jgi:hypothetical protein